MKRFMNILQIQYTQFYNDQNSLSKQIMKSFQYYIKISIIFRGMQFSSIIAQQQKFRQKSRILEQRIVKNNNRIKYINSIFDSLKFTCSQIQALVNENKNMFYNLTSYTPKLNQHQLGSSDSNYSQIFCPNSEKTQQIQNKIAMYSKQIGAKMLDLCDRGLYLRQKNRQLLSRMQYIKQNFRKFIDAEGSTFSNIPLAQQYRNVNIKIVSIMNLIGGKLSRLNNLEKYGRNSDEILTRALRKQQVLKRLKDNNFSMQNELSDLEKVSEYEIHDLFQKSNSLSQKFMLYLNSIAPRQEKGRQYHRY